MDSSDKIEMKRLIEMCNVKGLRPMRVIGTDGVQISKGENSKLEPISWDVFEESLRKRGLAVYCKLGWIKIMKDC